MLYHFAKSPNLRRSVKIKNFKLKILGIGLMFPWAIGYSILPWIAYAVPIWWQLQLVMSAPLPIFLIIYFFIPECPRWLLIKGRVNEAKTILENAVRINGSTWPDQMNLQALNTLKTDAGTDASADQESSADDNKSKANLLDLFNGFLEGVPRCCR